MRLGYNINMPRLKLMFCLYLTLLPGCKERQTISVVHQASQATEMKLARPLLISRPDLSFNTNDCSRGEPEAIFKNTARSIFTKTGPMQAEEVVTINSKNVVIVRQGGCETVIEEYSFRLTDLAPPSPKTATQWASLAASLLRNLAVRPERKSTVRFMAKALDNVVPKGYMLGLPIVASENETITVNVKEIADVTEISITRHIAL